MKYYTIIALSIAVSLAYAKKELTTNSINVANQTTTPIVVQITRPNKHPRIADDGSFIRYDELSNQTIEPGTKEIIQISTTQKPDTAITPHMYVHYAHEQVDATRNTNLPGMNLQQDEMAFNITQTDDIEHTLTIKKDILPLKALCRKVLLKHKIAYKNLPIELDLYVHGASTKNTHCSVQ